MDQKQLWGRMRNDQLRHNGQNKRGMMVSSYLLLAVFFIHYDTASFCQVQAFTIHNQSSMAIQPLRKGTVPNSARTSKNIRNVLMDDFQGMEVGNSIGEGEGEGRPQEDSKQKPIRRQRRSKKIPLIAIVGRPNVGTYTYPCMYG